ncbi:hypothetical protein ACH437_23760 [Streptomyces xinghaiensis]|uniref:hypothetical protein n=1 Tax=Streptomyces xinghaiensis TaxID=1038928 RepID=UPI003795CB59
MQLTTAEEVRDFLRLCLDPGPRLPARTVSQLVTIMPDWLAEHVAAHTPELAPLREEAAAAQTAATAALETYTEALRAWISGEPDPDPAPAATGQLNPASTPASGPEQAPAPGNPPRPRPRRSEDL